MYIWCLQLQYSGDTFNTSNIWFNHTTPQFSDYKYSHPLTHTSFRHFQAMNVLMYTKIIIMNHNIFTRLWAGPSVFNHSSLFWAHCVLQRIPCTKCGFDYLRTIRCCISSALCIFCLSGINKVSISLQLAIY